MINKNSGLINSYNKLKLIINDNKFKVTDTSIKTTK